MAGRVGITGANGNLGFRLIAQLGPASVRALVRSDRAKSTLLAKYPDVEVVVVDYTSAASLKTALDGCERVVHLVGVLKETSASTYEQAHEASCRALVSALPSTISQVVYLSILGSRADSDNACLASKGRAEELLLAANTDVTVLQVPMVLGEGDYASAALRRNALKSRAFAFRANSLEQPIYAGDVVGAIESSFTLKGKQHLALSGPESLTRAALFKRAGAIHQNEVSVVSLPIGLGMALAWIMERSANPPVTRAMLGVLDHDDRVDSQAAVDLLNIKLTPLDEMLKLTIG